jgi:hypothetical protein
LMPSVAPVFLGKRRVPRAVKEENAWQELVAQLHRLTAQHDPRTSQHARLS